jgi:glutamate synthase domain-containing protein 2
MSDDISPAPLPIQSATFSNAVNAEIRRAAATGIYDIRGGGAKRRVPHFDDLLFLGASISRYPLEGYRETCGTECHLGTRHREEPHRDGHPDHHRRHELRRAVGSGEGGAGPRRDAGRDLHHHRRWRHDRGGARAFEDAGLPVPAVALRHEPRRPAPADAIEVVVGQGAKPGGGGMLLGQKITDRVAEMRTCPRGSTSARPAATRTGPGRTTWKSRSWNCARSPTGEKPIYVKIGATRPYFDVALAVKAGADVVVIDGMQGGTAATQDVFIEHVGIPRSPASAPR